MTKNLHWDFNALFPFRLLLIRSNLTKTSQKSVQFFELNWDDWELGVVGSSFWYCCPWWASGKKWLGNDLAKAINVSSTCLQTSGDAWGWMIIVLVGCKFFLLDELLRWIWKTLVLQPKAASKLIDNQDDDGWVDVHKKKKDSFY